MNHFSKHIHNASHTNHNWSFDGEGHLLKLILEAYRIHFAHIFDPYMAVHTSEIEPLPHQIIAVYQEMLPRMPLRYVLADDPGAGKTIMTGLFVKELIMRGDIQRCLIVSPGSLTEQWQDELAHKFGLNFEILTNDNAESLSEINLCIARLDKLARNKILQHKLEVIEWDLIVIDEAHKMSATVWNKEARYTKRFILGRLLSKITRNFLLLTATPHNGKDKDFQLFMSLTDPDRYEGTAHTCSNSHDVSDVMRRLVKEDLLNFNGTPLFPERRAYTVNYDLSHDECDLYNEVTEYIRREFNLADKLNGRRRNNVGFALTILQRRLASSPEAIYQSLRRRAERLEERLREAKSSGHRRTYADEYNLDDDYDPEDFTSNENEETEENFAASSSASMTTRELETEIEILRRLERKAKYVRDSGEDTKWNQLSLLLQDNMHMFTPNGTHEKLIVFTEHRDTLSYLEGRIISLMGNDSSVVTIHGGMSRDERRKTEELFMNDNNVIILIATDAAGEGINLQRAHLMVNYDLPWNPNRIEQRFGRIHRIGQKEVCHLWNMVSKNTREGAVFQRLFEKLEREREALGGKVFDILGRLTFDNEPLRDLLIKAIRYGNDPAVREKLNRAVDNSLEQTHIMTLIEEHALTGDILNIKNVAEIRRDIERTETHKLQPYFIESFFIEAFSHIGGTIIPREKGRYEIKFMPLSVLKCKDVMPEYERICFDKNLCTLSGKIPAVLISPGHPLLEAVIKIIRTENQALLKRGAVFIDDNDTGSNMRILFAIEDSVQDGTKRIISTKIHFIEMNQDGKIFTAGYAPYIDYRPAELHEQNAALEYMHEHKLFNGNIQEEAAAYALEHIITDHLAQIKNQRMPMLLKTEKAVRERLTSEIRYWDSKASELKQNEAAGKVNHNLTSQNASRRADELEDRMNKRLAEIETEKNISSLPPEIICAALIIPKGLMHVLTSSESESESESESKGDRKRVELAAMNAVMQAELKHGYIPRDVSAEKCGYDIESVMRNNTNGSTEGIRFIEVKGRVKGAATVTVTANEILTCLNKPDSFILALVEVDGDTHSRIIYLRRPFTNYPDFAVTSMTFSISELIRHSEIIYEE